MTFIILLLNQMPETGIIWSLVISHIVLPFPHPLKKVKWGLASVLKTESHSCPCRLTGLKTRHLVFRAGLFSLLFFKKEVGAGVPWH